MRWIILFSMLVSGLHAYSQNPYPQEYDGYRSWSTFNQDTVRYLQYNWGLKVVVYITMFRYPIFSMYLNCQFVMSKFVAPLLAEGPRSDIFVFGCNRMKKHIRNGRNPESIQVNTAL